MVRRRGAGLDHVVAVVSGADLARALESCRCIDCLRALIYYGPVKLPPPLVDERRKKQ